jgi:dinuclear metal center YbgI/SA1388 family protein
MPRLQQILDAIHQLAPWDLAEPWDQVGLQVGRKDQPVRRILVALDFSDAVFAEGLTHQVDGFLVHHPLIFKPVTRIQTDTPLGGYLTGLIQKDLFLIAAHTNVDKAETGLNHYLAKLLGLQRIETLETTPAQSYKVVVFTPEECWKKIQLAMVEAGAGEIGAYTDCSFRLPGTGTFKPNCGAQPYIGQIGTVEEVPEVRLEMLVRQGNLSRVLHGIIANHPYEEPVIDVYPLLNSTQSGIGRVGCLPEPVCFEDFCRLVKERLPAQELRVLGEPRQMIQRVAICSGSGGKLISTVLSQKADLYLTADLGYHDYLTAREHGLSVIDAGHWTTEKGFISLLSDFLTGFFEGESCFEVIPSVSVRKEPYITFI